MSVLEPRALSSVLVDTTADAVTVTWDLGERIDGAAPGFMSYGVVLVGDAGSVVRHFAVKMFTTSPTIAYVFDFGSATQANYTADDVTLGDSSIVARVHDASLGIEDVTSATAWLNVDGRDVETEHPVTLLTA